MGYADVPRLEPGCPWSDWAPPTIKWCEDNVCGWITAPANTWSNLAYLVAAIWIWRQARGRDRPDLVLFGTLTAFLGLASALFHASYTLFFQFFDYIGMFLVLSLVATIQLRRAGRIGPGRERAGLVLGTIGFSLVFLAFYRLQVPVQTIILLGILLLIGQEVALSRRSELPPTSYGRFVSSIILLTLAGLFSLADITGWMCDPSDHWWQGHALWHVFSAAALVEIYHFHEQFPFEERGEVSVGEAPTRSGEPRPRRPIPAG